MRLKPENTKVASVRIKLWMSFTLAAVVILVVNWISMRCLAPIDRYDTAGAQMAAVDPSAYRVPGDAIMTIQRVTSTALISSAAIILILVATGTYVNRILLQPLERTTAAARRIAQGNLDILVPINVRDEIGDLGEQINDIAMNTQEILLCMWNSSSRLGEALNSAADALNSGEKNASSGTTGDRIAAARGMLDEMRGTIESFGLYGVKLVKNKVMGSHNGH
jgi:methyl-accepting chemotaxis protein